ncbi:MAG: fasciclin domain-containing protein [Flavobacteriales bacterium]|jgi:uncharacterized surface protein with fasciclin (FAS1) repeats
MKRFPTAILFILLIAFGCNNNTPESSNTPKTGSKPLSDTLTAAQKAEIIKNQRPNKYNTSNIVSYINSDPYCTIWSGMVTKTKWAKELGTGNWTLLVPSNEVVTTLDEKFLISLRDPKNQKALDDYISYFIIEKSLNVDKPGDATEIKTIAGKTLDVQVGAQNIGGNTYRKNPVYTEQGMVVYLSSITANIRTK